MAAGTEGSEGLQVGTAGEAWGVSEQRCSLQHPWGGKSTDSCGIDGFLLAVPTSFPGELQVLFTPGRSGRRPSARLVLLPGTEVAP